LVAGADDPLSLDATALQAKANLKAKVRKKIEKAKKNFVFPFAFRSLIRTFD